MMRAIQWFLLACLIMPVSQAQAGFNEEIFDRWVSMRAGDGEPVYWYSIGTVRSYPDGEVLFTLEGFDTARSIPDPDKPHKVHQLNRKIYVFRDVETNEVLETYNGQPVEPITYPYQLISYELDGKDIVTWVEQGSGERVNRIGPGRDISVRKLGDTLVFSAPVFLDFEIPGGRYQAFENYDFFLQPEDKGLAEPHQLSWIRYGAGPRFMGGSDTVMHLVTWRVEDFDDMPETITRYIEDKHPLWMAPPKDMDEIRRLQE